MVLRRLFALLWVLTLALPASAQDDCPFSFEIDAQSSALQALVEGAEARGGFWRPIREAPDDVQQMAAFIGRLDICLMTPDGKPATVSTRQGSITVDSPYVTSCTAALLPGNRLLTNVHCFYEPSFVRAGLTIVAEARINFGYASKDFTGDVRSFRVATRELAMDRDTDAMVLQIIGADANGALGGHVPMQMETRVTPRRALTMIHHPKGEPLQFSSGTCQVAPEQAELPETASQLRHSCETAGGSSGSLLLDSRTLAVVGLHNQGGLSKDGGFNGGHKIASVEKALKLGFRQVTPEPAASPAPLAPSPDVLAQAALTEAFQAPDDATRRAALEAVVSDFPDSRAATSARNALALMAPKVATRDERANAALIAALQVLDDAEKTTQLLDIVRLFEGTVAAGSAEAMLRSMSNMPVPTPRPAEMADALKLVSWGGAYQHSQQKAYVEPYVKLNAGLKASWAEKSAEAVTYLGQSGNREAATWDLVDVVATDAIRLCDQGLAEPIDHDLVLAPATDGTPPTRDFGQFIVNDCFIPQIVYSMAFGYRTDMVGGRAPTSVCDIFDLRRYPGKRALEKRPKGNMEWALLCDGVPEDRLYDVLATPAGQERALAKLDTIKRHVIWWQAGADTPKLLGEGKIVMGSTYNGRLFSLIVDQGAPVEMLWDRQILDLDGWVLPKGLPANRKARALDFVRFATDTQRLSDQARHIAYGPARRSSAALPVRHAIHGIDMSNHIPTAPQNARTALLYNYDFWARHLGTIDSRFQKWLAR